MPFAATWMDLEVTLLKEVSQAEKDKYRMLSLPCGILKKKKKRYKVFPSNPAVKTPPFQCRGGGFNLQSGNGTWCGQNENLILERYK